MTDNPASEPPEESEELANPADAPATDDVGDGGDGEDLNAQAATTDTASPVASHAGTIKIGSRRDRDSAPSGSKPQLAGDVNITPPQEEPSVPVPAESDEAVEAAPTPDPTPDPTPVPIPSIHAITSEDLEAEIQQALGDTSLDDLISGESAARAGNQLEDNSRQTGIVIRCHGEHVFVTVGTGHEGVVPLKQLDKPPEKGQQLELIVRSFNIEDGLYDLAIPGAAMEVSDWSDLQEGIIVEARITGANTGGLECMVNQIRGFIPASQIGVFRVENFADYIGTKLPCVVTEAQRRKKNLVLSHRSVLEREAESNRKEKLEQLQVGQTVEGVVRSVKDFGVFVDLGGIDGLVHVSQLSWDRVKHPSEVASVGDKIRVKIEKLNTQTGRISLSARALMEHPWTGIASRFSSGQVVTGTVTRLADFGAFVKLAPAIEGLIHISELAHHRVGRVDEVLSEGGEVEVKIISVNPEEQRISLSLKQLQEVPQVETSEQSEDDAEEPRRELVIKPRKKPLKGGTDRPSGGDQVGLNW